MSNEVVDELLKKLNSHKEIKLKQEEIQANKINNEYEQLKTTQKELEIARNATFGPHDANKVAQLTKESSEYINDAKKGMKFMNNTLSGLIPMFRTNLILIAAPTGSGKSTCVTNIVRTNLGQISEVTGKPKTTLVITNEQAAVDVFNGVTCLIKGWPYVNHNQFTEEQKLEFEKWIPRLAEDGRLTVVDDSYELDGNTSIGGMTTTVEGIEMIFENLMRDGIYYDCIILDYYQGVIESKKNPHLKDWEVQEKLTHTLEKYRKLYPAPIIVMAQITPPEAKNTAPVQVRLQGRKLICNKSTVILEMIADRENLKTEWKFHKSRFGLAVGTSVFTGFDKGRFIDITREFLQKVATHKEKEAHKNMLKSVFEEPKEEKKEEENGNNP